MTKLTNQQELFCQAMLAAKTQAEAYRKAFPSSRKWGRDSVYVKASVLMAKDKIKVRLAELRQPIIDEAIMSRREVLLTASRAARADIRKTVDDEDKPLPLKQLGENEAAAVAHYETTGLFAGKGKERKEIGLTRTYRLADRLKALELIAKMQGYYHDEEEGDVSKVPPRVEVVFVDAAGDNVQVNVGQPRA